MPALEGGQCIGDLTAVRPRFSSPGLPLLDGDEIDEPPPGDEIVHKVAAWRSTANRVGRPKLDAEIRHLIHRMARDNPTWGRRRIRAELALLGYDVAELTVAKYMHRASPRPSPTWRVFLTTHARDIVAIDFFVVPPHLPPALRLRAHVDWLLDTPGSAAPSRDRWAGQPRHRWHDQA
jgi:hypothetical protein